MKKQRQKTWTVIAYRESTGETITYTEQGIAALDAMVNVAVSFESEADDVVFVGAVKGIVELIAPCDSGCTAAACDLPVDDEENPDA